MRSSQDQIFAAFEGDKWFERNKADIERFDPGSDIPLKLTDLYSLRPQKVLEVGAANGFRLATIHERYNARVVAVEPSARAIRDGKTRFPCVDFIRAEAYAIPLQELFDFIIVNSVFHWIDRNNLLCSVAEIDRLLADSGFLIIGYFYPANLVKVRYHYLAQQDVYTYKQNYAATFLATGLYHPVCLLTRQAGSNTLTPRAAEDNRVGTWLLRKSLTDYYVEGTFRR